MSFRSLTVLALASAAVASQATITFTTLNAVTTGAGGSVPFTPTVSGSTLTGNANRTASGFMVAGLNLNVKATTDVGILSSVTFDLYFTPSAATKLSGTFTYNPIGLHLGADADLAGGVYQMTPSGTPVGLAVLPAPTVVSTVVIAGTPYTKVSYTKSLLSYNSAKFHFILDNQFASGSLKMVDTTVNTVPEPASMAALGLGAVALLRRRRKA